MDQLYVLILYEGFLYGFKIHYSGPRTAVDSKNLKSVFQHPSLVLEKIQSEIELGRIAGPFHNRPISPIGLVPKKTGGFRLITHCSVKFIGLLPNVQTFVWSWKTSEINKS
jgi:hypothetical protein